MASPSRDLTSIVFVSRWDGTAIKPPLWSSPAVKAYVADIEDLMAKQNLDQIPKDSEWP